MKNTSHKPADILSRAVVVVCRRDSLSQKGNCLRLCPQTVGGTLSPSQGRNFIVVAVSHFHDGFGRSFQLLGVAGRTHNGVLQTNIPIFVNAKRTKGISVFLRKRYCTILVLILRP